MDFSKKIPTCNYFCLLLVFPIVILGCLFAIWVAFTRSTESSGDTLPLNEVWSFRVDGRILSTPILIEDQIIFRTADKVYSVNAVNGNMNWEIAARASDITINVNYIGKPLVGNSIFLISEEQNNSIGIYSTRTGERLWAVDGDSNSLNALAIVDDVMITARHDRNLVVYDLSSHQELWEVVLPARSGTPLAANTDFVVLGAMDVLRVYSLKEGIIVNEKIYNEGSISDIALDGSNIFVSVAANGDWQVFSLQLETLDENWMFRAGDTNPDLSVTSGFLSLFNHNLILLDTNNGDIIWRDDSQKYYSEPAFHGNSLFFISLQRMFSNDKELCKVETREAAIKECSLVESTGRLITSQSYLLRPLVAKDLLIVPRGSELVAFTMP